MTLEIDKLYEKEHLVKENKKIDKNHKIVKNVPSSNNYFTFNHLTAMGDFNEELFQNQTFLLINAFPGKKKIFKYKKN